MVAIDTNVLIYARNKGDTRRQKIALDLIASYGWRAPVGRWPLSSSTHPES